jgi:peptide/nickel transport system ATP-binding protein
MTATPLLEVRDLTLALQEGGYRRRVIDGVSFDLARGETLAIVGESGCGKTMTALSMLRLEPSPSVRITSGSIRLGGTELVGLGEAAMTGIRGRRIAMIFQEPMNALNPTMTIGDQIHEALMAHLALSRRAARDRVTELLSLVGLPDPRRQAESYPHRLSGGMRQRAMIAMALSCEPELLVADEPTTALDVTIQAQILALLNELQQRTGVGILLITHDLGVVRRVAHRVLVMYAGRVAEAGDVQAVLRTPHHPYTVGLMGAIPGVDETDTDIRKRLVEIAGSVPAPGSVGGACAFANRCGQTMDCCHLSTPVLVSVGPGHAAACRRLEVAA